MRAGAPPPRVVIVLALLGFAIAGYLTLDQIGAVTAWEPFFGRGTEAVLHSKFSRALPVPDAALGALAYLVEAVSALGGATRGGLDAASVVYVVTGVGLGLAAIALVLVQAGVVRAWCTFCLVSAAISLTLAIPAARNGIVMWRRWRGDTR